MSQAKVAIVAVGVLLAGLVYLSLPGGSKKSGRSGSPGGRPAATHPLQKRFDAVPPTPMPPLPEFANIIPGVKLAILNLGGSGPAGNTELYILLPDKPATPASLPCVFVAPAGSIGFTGMGLADGDLDECVPYVEAGFAVVAYSLDGENDDENPRALKKSLDDFRAVAGGAGNARAAIDYALAKIPEIDPSRLYAAGHSSAAATSLMAAMFDPRLRAVAAYAPCTDYVEGQGRVLRLLDRSIPGLIQFAGEVSVLNHAEHIRVPVLLFTAKDDNLMNVHSSTLALHTAMSKAGLDSTLLVVPTGGHYDSMIDEGIPAGIQFFTNHGAFTTPLRRASTKLMTAPTSTTRPTAKP